MANTYHHEAFGRQPIRLRRDGASWVVSHGRGAPAQTFATRQQALAFCRSLATIRGNAAAELAAVQADLDGARWEGGER